MGSAGRDGPLPEVPESSPSVTGLYLNSFASTLGSRIENKALSKECQPGIARPSTSRLQLKFRETNKKKRRKEKEEKKRTLARLLFRLLSLIVTAMTPQSESVASSGELGTLVFALLSSRDRESRAATFPHS
jgi:hypothetical protein